MDAAEHELAELRRQVEDLQRRIAKLESLTPQAPSSPIAVLQPAQVPPSRPVPGAALPFPPPQFAPLPRPGKQSLENRIGTHWLNRVGIVAVLIGVSYFLKYAFDNGWIGPAGRVVIGLLAGMAITAWSEVFRRKKYLLFSYGLKAIGIGTLYLSLWAAVQMYHLISPGIGFGAMLLVTASTVAVALNEEAQLLAAYALAGGFATPALCSTGGNHEVFLFSYIAVLALGAVVLTALRGWRRLALGAFAGTFLMYGAWYGAYYEPGELATTLVFATFFFLIFAAAALVPRSNEPPDSTALAAIVAIGNALVYFFQLYAIFDSRRPIASRDDILAWIAVALAAFYVILAQQVGRQSEGAENRRAMNLIHLALAVGFLTIAIPLKFHGHWISIGWLIESAALLYVARRIRHDFLKIFAVAALALGLIHLLLESWPRQSTLLLNERFGTYLFAIAVLSLIVWTTRDARSGSERLASRLCIVVLNLLALVALHYEVQDFFFVEVGGYDWKNPAHNAAMGKALRATETVRSFTHSAVWMIYGAVLMFLGFRRSSAFLRWLAIVLLGMAVLKVFLFDTSLLDLGFRVLSFIGLGVILLGISYLYQKGHLSLASADSKPEPGVSS